eukprot:NODE_1760_length_2380_cov_3.280071.p1 GENE.NODE_1760_length_2380_cov_3.280071~~NODE_1760_length_2380_cov_3.280071.p1  ORF type:complete len:602 (+),score=44.74 NODE_1760_length_2380_cov_3.280071:342-2147(+)
MQFHPDKYSGDDTVAKQLILAHLVLSDKDKKKEYDRHLKSVSVISRSFWSQLWEDMKNADPTWWAQFGLSAVCVVGGGIAIICTGGSATPVVVIVGGVVGGAFAGGGFVAGKALFAVENRLEGLSAQEYAKRFGVGVLAGALSGGVAGVAQVAIVGVGEAAVVSAGTYAAVGATSGAAGGAAFRVTDHVFESDAVTAGSVGKEALVGAIGGAAAGAVAGAIGGAFAARCADEVGGVAAATFGQKMGAACLKGLAGATAQALVNETDETLTQAVADDTEQEAPSVDAAAGKALNIAVGAGTGALAVMAVDAVTHVYEAATSGEKLKTKAMHRKAHQETETADGGYCYSSAKERVLAAENRYFESVNEYNIGQREIGGREISMKALGEGLNINAAVPARDCVPGCVMPKPMPEASREEPKPDVPEPQPDVPQYHDAPETSDVHWISMKVCGPSQYPGSVQDMHLFVRYTDFDGSRKTYIARGHGSGIEVPGAARDVSVTFSLTTCVPKFASPFKEANLGIDVGCKYDHFVFQRSGGAHFPLWRYDRINRKWGGRNHVFEYQTPQTRTFWLDDADVWAKVWKVTDETHQPVNEEGHERCVDKAI